MKKVLSALILLALVANSAYSQNKIANPKCARNAHGLITLQDCPTKHSQLSVKINDECNKLTIYLNEKELQKIEREEEFASPADDCTVHYLDANFDGYCDIFVGPGESRTYSTLLLYNPRKGKFEPVGELGNPSLQNFMIDPVNKVVYDGGSSSFCELNGDKLKWNGNRLMVIEKLKVISDPKEYRANGVKYKYTIKNAKTGKLVKATNFTQNLPASWLKLAKTLDW